MSPGAPVALFFRREPDTIPNCIAPVPDRPKILRKIRRRHIRNRIGCSHYRPGVPARVPA